MFFLILMVGILAFTVVEPMLPYAPEANTIYKGATNQMCIRDRPWPAR